MSKIVILFGRPGAGKTTIATRVIELFYAIASPHHVVALDLDVCIPTWMKENFSKGIYPTLEQRIQFATNACEYVQEKVATIRQSDKVLISFSFVNSDLREIFKERFSNAEWFLVDTSPEEAEHRIQQRKHHFYKGPPQLQTSCKNDSQVQHEEAMHSSVSDKIKEQKNNMQNSDWSFAPVEFEHVVLDGLCSIDVNAKRILEVLMNDEEIR